MPLSLCKYEGRGSLQDIKEKSRCKEEEELIDFLEDFNVRTNVLTAHPTQFYPAV
jgi:phosphoenolpyruvate carboxylase